MSGKGLAMMPWFPRDFIASTRAMRLAERGAYRELLDYQWEMGSLPTDPERLARLLGISTAEFSELWPMIESKFITVDNTFINQRLEEHRQKAIEQRSRKIDAANLTNAKRYGERLNGVSHSDSLSDTVSDTRSDSLSASPPSPTPTSKRESSRASQNESLSDTLSEPRRKRTRRCPKDFQPDRELALSECPDMDVDQEIQKMRDWEFDPPRSDFVAVWRNWVRRCKENKKYARTTTGINPAEWR